ncbi:MAG: transposase domain-containing protein [Bacteroidales bacterium]|nr:transposase domain-containing protein [Bacteroidales bacterium]
MFAGSHEGAQRAAMMYSFLGTCKINDVEPFAWLKDVLARIQDHSIQKLEELLPGHQTENIG